MHRRLVNEAGDAPEDMQMGRHFHVPAETFVYAVTPLFLFGSMVVLQCSACYIPKQVSMHGDNSIGYVLSN